ncbi:MAG: nucleotide exchange factor GrpE [Chloroflexi bacterium]|nr:nucleotide exchange factor GrpE [Chloroflexota bacterium]
MSMQEPRNAAGEGPGPPSAATEAMISTNEALDLLQRERANFVNYKRRTEQERAEDRERAVAATLLPLLPLLDDLDRAIVQRPDALADDAWAQGVALIRNRLRETLGKLGVVALGAVGEPFDPTLHEALFFEVRAGGEPVVAEVLCPGYRIGERLIRPAQVRVSGPAGAPESGAHNGHAPPSAEGGKRETSDEDRGGRD